MSGVNFTCPICQHTGERATLEAHIAESHSSPETSRQYNGAAVTEADFIRSTIAGTGSSGTNDDDPPPVVVPRTTQLEAVGLNIANMSGVDVDIETGDSLQKAEVTRVLAAASKYAGFRINKESFVINFLAWGFENSFSEELSGAGGFTLISVANERFQTKFAAVADLNGAIKDEFDASPSGRQFTFRRLGRYFASSIPRILEVNEALGRYKKTGTGISNRLGVAPHLFLTTTSIFPSIKPYATWNEDEKAAFEAHRLSVTKEAATRMNKPEDLRPAPDLAQNWRSSGVDDVSNEKRKHLVELYGNGAEIWDRMAMGSSSNREGLGHKK